MPILIAMPDRDCKPLQSQLHELDASLDIRIWPELGNRDEIDFMVSWQHPHGLTAKLPKLQVVQSYGAGVEHILDDPQLAQSTQVTRVVGKQLAASMQQYLLAQVAQHQQGENQATTIGILGLGELGSSTAQTFVQQGYPVIGLSQSVRQINGVVNVTGGQGFVQLAGQADVLICLLPLTRATENILNVRLFSLCKPGAYLINVGRGAHLIEADLIHAIDEGQLRGATLDVTRQEPLPQQHPFRQHPDIQLTEHTASITDPREAAAIIYANFQRFRDGRSLLYQVDRKAGY